MLSATVSCGANSRTAQGPFASFANDGRRRSETFARQPARQGQPSLLAELRASSDGIEAIGPLRIYQEAGVPNNDTLKVCLTHIGAVKTGTAEISSGKGGALEVDADHQSILQDCSIESGATVSTTLDVGVRKVCTSKIASVEVGPPEAKSKSHFASREPFASTLCSLGPRWRS